MNSTTSLRHPAAAQFTQARDAVERELLIVLGHHARTHGDHLIVVALCETFIDLAVRLVEADPATRSFLLNRIDELQLHIGTAGQRPQ
jgi:hypothetical protein